MVLNILRIFIHPEKINTKRHSIEWSLPDDIHSQFERDYLHRALDMAFKDIGDRQRLILETRKGFNFDRKHTLNEGAKVVCISRERVRQIEEKSFLELRKGLVGQELSSFL